MYLRRQNVILIGIYLLITPFSVFSYKNNIKILFNYLQDETSTNQKNCTERILCDKNNLSETNIFTKQKSIEILNNLYKKEKSVAKEDKTSDQLAKIDDVKSSTIIAMIIADDDANKENISKNTTITASAENIANTTEKEPETSMTLNKDKNETFSTVENIASTTEKEPETSMTLNKDNNETSSTEQVLSDLIPLTTIADTDLHTGQSIELQRSHNDSVGEFTNEAGVEILKNTSSVCGSLLGKRISFANETTLMEFPWTVLLLYNTKEIYHCGGSLITSKYVLTAAHCVAQEFYELTGVRLGEHDVTKEKDCDQDIAGDVICSNTVDAKVVKIIIHHGYSHLSFKNDIALLRLEQDYYSRSFYPICLPTPESTYTSTMAIVAGWGATEKAIRSTVLRKAEVPILDMSKCRSIYRYSKFNDTTEICGSGVNEVDVCQGDSGGAIFYSSYVNKRQKFYQLGIISLGVRRCGDKRFLPAVFTKINGFYRWIESNLEY